MLTSLLNVTGGRDCMMCETFLVAIVQKYPQNFNTLRYCPLYPYTVQEQFTRITQTTIQTY